jgi:hypothetical protein
LTQNGFYNATTSVEQITVFWSSTPAANVAIRTGPESQIVVLDIDNKTSGEKTLRELEKKNGYLPKTLEAITGAGRHFYFKYPAGVDIPSRVGIAPGIDIKARGGYAIAPPSIHKSGKRYAWVDKLMTPDELPELPAWIAKLATQHSKAPRSNANGGRVLEGHRNEHLTSLAGSMRRPGMSEAAILAALKVENENQCDPPLPDCEVEGIAHSIARYDPEAKSRNGKYAASQAVTLEDFRAYMPDHQYIFIPTGELWPGSSVNARIKPIPTGRIDPKKDKEKYEAASEWLDRNQPVEQMTWAPGESTLISDQLVSEGGWIRRPGCHTFNLYRPPQITLGDPAKAKPWLEHLSRIYGSEEVDHILFWLAHRVQRPGEKINHALLLGGPQGIGKDTLLEPVVSAVGPWNFVDVSPSVLIGRFNGFVKSVILRISEARDLGDINRFAFYEHLKTLTAAPPDVLRVDEKNRREYSVMNVCGVVMTTNHKTDGVYLPPEDRRHFVCWSDVTKEDFTPEYFQEFYRFLDTGGRGHVAAYLHSLDLSRFDPKAPPPKTAAFWDIVDASRAPEDSELADLLDTMGRPDAVTLEDLATWAGDVFRLWLRDPKNKKQIPHRLESAGYVRVRNDVAQDGFWRIQGRRQAIYAKQDLPKRDRFAVAAARAGRP